MDDLSEVVIKVLNQAVNEGVRWLKERTPTGIHPNPVTFKVKSGPKAGKVVSFKTKDTIVGGLLKNHGDLLLLQKAHPAQRRYWSTRRSMLLTGIMGIVLYCAKADRRKAL